MATSYSILQPMNIENAEIQATLTEVRILDHELLEHPDTRQLIEMGAQFGAEVTEQFGTPNNPKWAHGSIEYGVFMSYHNGGPDGHTSTSPKGTGVPRNVLIIAKAVNDAAGREVFNPMMRATAFYGAEAHDKKQFFGRTLLPEGQGADNGDERMSAKEARDRYLAAGGNPKVAQQTYDNIIATAFNPQTSTQNVNYVAWRTNPSDPVLTRKVLGQELTAAADLLSPTSKRGLLGSIEHCVEVMCLGLKDRVIQERMQVRGINPTAITSMEQMLVIIGEDNTLRQGFTDTLVGNSKFVSDYLKYSDYAIRAACGKGIDELFPGRAENATALSQYGVVLHAGMTPLEIWRQARITAGY